MNCGNEIGLDGLWRVFLFRWLGGVLLARKPIVEDRSDLFSIDNWATKRIVSQSLFFRLGVEIRLMP
jgi:hypothetical protein